MAKLRISDELSIDESELSEDFVRSSGPGGQNVNKVATTVQLHFDLGASALPEEVKARLRSSAGSRIDSRDVLHIEARRFRTRERNRQDARRRLVELIQAAVPRPKPRRPTRPTAGSKRRRLEGKRRTGRTKSLRSRVSPDSD